MNHDVDAERRQAVLRHFVNARYLEPEFPSTVDHGLDAGYSAVFTLDSFLNRPVAERLAQALVRWPQWERAYVLKDGYRRVDLAEWSATEPDEHLATHFVATGWSEDPSTTSSAFEADRRVLLQFLGFATSSGILRSWLSRLFLRTLSPHHSLEVDAYEKGDYTRSHQDLVGTRTATVNFYLDQAWTAADGGHLAFKAEGQQVTLTAPAFNRLAIIPVSPVYWHWVEAFTGGRRGRQSISVGIHGA